MKASVERVWWHGLGCGAEVAAPERPTACPKCHAEVVYWMDLGWRVGYNAQTYSYYASFESAQRDKRA